MDDVRDESSCVRTALLQPLKSADDGVYRQATIIHAQVRQMLRSDRARSTAACAHDSTTVRVCMARRN